ncbi:6215_t:CDS:2, partial [Racocetra persica]
NIRQTEISMEYLVPSKKKGTDLFYTVNTELCKCTCFVGLSGAPCKHQGAVAAKYHVESLNFFLSLMPNDCTHFAYIVCEMIANDSFYASLRTHANNYQYRQSNKIQIVATSDSSVDQILAIDMNVDKIVPDIDTNHISATNMNLNEVVSDVDTNQIAATEVTVKNDYETCGPQLRSALEKFAERYNSAKTRSILVLVKSSAKIHVQVESVKHRKMESGAKKSNNKENDPHVILARK